MIRMFQRGSVVAGLLSLLTYSASGDIPVNHGYDDLEARLGVGNAPLGTDVLVGMVEVPDGGGDYSPDKNHVQFTTVTFVDESGPTGPNSHATQVGRRFFGNKAFSIALDLVHLYEVNNWLLAGFLRAGLSGTPLALPAGLKVLNHSWIGNASTNELNNNVLRRADFVMARDDILMVVGVGNFDDPNSPLLSHIYNGLSVGLAPPEEHQPGNTLSGMDGPGRLKPEIVTMELKTSYATPFVSGGVAILTETARDMAARGASITAERGEVLKAVLMAGAQKFAGWTNNPVISGPNRGQTLQPIDTVTGVGTLDVNRAHLILTGNEQNGDSAVPTVANIQHAGWDLASVSTASSSYYRFRLRDEADSVDVVATWHRRVPSNFNSFTVADFDLHLWRVDDQDQLLPLLGDDGLGVFASGNINSVSTINNVEHLHIEGLAACEYVIEVRRNDSVSADAWDIAVAWIMPEPLTCLADVDRMNNAVDVFDLLDLLSAWGSCPEPCPSSCPADITGDNVVNVFDLLDLLAAWGACPAGG